ncbi:hypothetical protein ACLB1G_12100 [Oxalobacteraceae bacterium A2-2]
MKQGQQQGIGQHALRQIIVVPLVLSGLASLHACGAAGRVRAEGPPAYDTTVELAPGLAAALPGGGSLRLDRVNDSRCRAGAVCVWAGYISYSLTVTEPNGVSTSFVLAQDMPNGVNSIRRNGLRVALAGDSAPPVPAQQEIAPDYRVSLRVSNIPVN